jgi:hypothetical protein
MPWREQTLPMQVSHVYAMTFIGCALLIEPVPVAGAFATQGFHLWLFAEIIRKVYRVPITGCANYGSLWASESP